MTVRTVGEHRRDPEEPIFTFAVIADSHMNPQDDACSSPWEVNRLSNTRTRAVVDDLNRLAPDFVIHLGDMIHPVPSQQTYPAAAERFRKLFGELSMPLHVVPGNHDVGDKPLDWTPAAVVTEQYVELYEQHFGASYYSFTHAGCLFVVLNAQLLNTGFPAEASQRVWLESTLADAERSFIFLHYPPFVLDAEEAGHYDNLDEPARSWLLDLIGRHAVEGVFAGHVHNFFYDHISGTDFYILPSISFVRSDYSEFARIVPDDDSHGRNDIGKLGYFLVQVYADDHRPIIHRTYGRSAAEIGSPAPVEQMLPTAARSAAATSVGVDLRHPWAEVVEIPYTGGVDEFARKKARNDYPLLALWELGVQRLRVPLADLMDETTRSRARTLARNGQRFTPFVLGMPSAAEKQVLLGESEMLDGVEVILPGTLADQLDDLTALREELGLPIVLSKLRGHAGVGTGSGQYHHVINHGYLVDEVDMLAELVGGDLGRFVDAIVFRVAHDHDPAVELARVQEVSRDLSVKGVAHVRLADDVPAVARTDELAAANRIATTLTASVAFPDTDTYVDSFMDQDRGYFPRTGLVDRRFNLRLAGHVFRNLNVALTDPYELKQVSIADGLSGFILRAEDVTQVLLLPTSEQKIRRIPLTSPSEMLATHDAVVFDLGEGSISRVPWDIGEYGAELKETLAISNPVLLEFTASTRR